MGVCPDPRGPMVDRTDFIEGQIDALEAIERAFMDTIDEVIHDLDALEVRGQLDATFSGNSLLEQYAADLDLAALDMEAAIRNALQQARWKLARMQKVGATP